MPRLRTNRLIDCVVLLSDGQSAYCRPRAFAVVSFLCRLQQLRGDDIRIIHVVLNSIRSKPLVNAWHVFVLHTRRGTGYGLVRYFDAAPLWWALRSRRCLSCHDGRHHCCSSICILCSVGGNTTEVARSFVTAQERLPNRDFRAIHFLL